MVVSYATCHMCHGNGCINKPSKTTSLPCLTIYGSVDDSANSALSSSSDSVCSICVDSNRTHDTRWRLEGEFEANDPCSGDKAASE